MIKRVSTCIAFALALFLVGCSSEPSEQPAPKDEIVKIEGIKLTNPNGGKKEADLVLVPDDIYPVEVEISPAGITEKDLDIVIEKKECISASNIKYSDAGDHTILSFDLKVLQHTVEHSHEYAPIKLVPKNGNDAYISVDIHVAEFFDPDPITMKVGDVAEVDFKVRPAYYDVDKFDLHANAYDVYFSSVEITGTEKDFDNNCQYLHTRIKCSGRGNSSTHTIMLTDKDRYYGADLSVTVKE